MSEQKAKQLAADIKLGDAPLWVEQAQVNAVIDVFTFGEDGAHTGQDKAKADPREPGRYLIPANATTEAPPVVLLADEEAAQVAGVWVKRKKLAKVDAQGGVKRTPEQIRRDQISDRLDVIDRQSVRALRDSIQAIAKGKPVPAAAVTKLDTLEAEAVVLRTELQGLKP